MKKYIIHRGSASIGFIIVLSLSAFIISALGHGNIQPTPFVTKKADAWWSEQEKKVSKQYTKEQTKNPGLSTKNMGLKDPDDITWPYGEEFTYKLVVRNEIKDDLGMPVKSTSRSYYETANSGGTFKEELTIRSKYEHGLLGAKVTFDVNRKVRGLNLYIEMKEAMHGMGGSETIRIGFRFEEQDGITELYLDVPPELVEDGFPLINDIIEFDTPDDGYFYFTGADTPGFVALLLSAVDIDGKKPVKVWVFNSSLFLLIGEEAEELRDPEDFLTYVTISDLNECPDETKEWWEDSRKYFNNWKPSLGVRTIIFEGNTDTFYPFYDESWYFTEDADIPDTYMPYGPFAVAYVDEEGRMIRFEQPGGFLCKTAMLEDIETGKPWWGEKGEE